MTRSETLVDGFKQGVNLKSIKSSSLDCGKMAKFSSIVCRRRFSEQYTNLLRISGQPYDSSNCYHQLKAMNENYADKWAKLKRFYRHWVNNGVKISAQKFCA